MKKVILTIGIPGSGKTTWSKKFVQENESYVRISRDGFRLMLKAIPMGDSILEKLVTDLVNSSIITAIAYGYDVIVDQTNCNKKYLNQLVEFCSILGDVEYKIFDIEVEEAIKRDLGRENPVGEKVIRRMYDNFTRIL